MRMKSSSWRSDTMSAGSYPGFCFGPKETRRRAPRVGDGQIQLHQPSPKQLKAHLAKGGKRKRRGEYGS